MPSAASNSDIEKRRCRETAGSLMYQSRKRSFKLGERDGDCGAVASDSFLSCERWAFTDVLAEFFRWWWYRHTSYHIPVTAGHSIRFHSVTPKPQVSVRRVIAVRHGMEVYTPSTRTGAPYGSVAAFSKLRRAARKLGSL